MRLKSVATSMLESVLSAITWLPHAYQKRAIKWLLEHASAGVFLDPGLGKTSIVLAALKILKKRGMLKGALVIAPLRVCRLVWPEERDKWKDFNGLTMEILHGRDKEAALFRDADIYLINPEGLLWLFGPPPLKGKPGKNASAEDVRTWERAKRENDKERARAAPLTKRILNETNVLVVDESTKFKHTNNNRFKILKQYLSKFHFRWILTGSPAPNGYLDLFGQCFVMDSGLALGSYITHYRRDYFISTGFGGFTFVLKPQGDKLIQARLRPSILSLRAEDYLEMPELVENVIRVDLPEKAQKIYKEMEDELFVLIDREEVEAVNAAVASMKCRQIANGAIYKDKRKSDKALHVHDAKIEALQDLVEELSGQPILIGYEFGHDLERLRKAFGKNVPVLGVGSEKKDKELKLAWNAGKIPLLFGQPASVGHGLNLQDGGHHVGFFSMIYDWELLDQFMRRVYRQGQTGRQVVVHYFVARNTVDEAILKVIRGKDKTQRALVLALKALRGRK